jgi:hypothetical protein
MSFSTVVWRMLVAFVVFRLAMVGVRVAFDPSPLFPQTPEPTAGEVLSNAVASGAALGGRIAVVTGANSGIGKETARVLASAGMIVVMGCRSARRCAEARNELAAGLPEVCFPHTHIPYHAL